MVRQVPCNVGLGGGFFLAKLSCVAFRNVVIYDGSILHFKLRTSTESSLQGLETGLCQRSVKRKMRVLMFPKKSHLVMTIGKRDGVVDYLQRLVIFH